MMLIDKNNARIGLLFRSGLNIKSFINQSFVIYDRLWRVVYWRMFTAVKNPIWSAAASHWNKSKNKNPKLKQNLNPRNKSQSNIFVIAAFSRAFNLNSHERKKRLLSH